MRHQEIKVMIVNKTPLDLFIYYTGVPVFMLRVSASEHEQKDLEDRGYLKCSLLSHATMTLPLGKAWRYFNGIKFDQQGIRNHYLTIEETSDEATGEYWARIDIAPN